MTSASPTTNVSSMTTGQHTPGHQDVAVVRPRHHVENVRQDANAVAEESAVADGGEPDYLISDTISWALGDLDQAPFTRTATPGGAGPAHLGNEIAACSAHLRSTPSTEENVESVGNARDVLKVLEWLTGADDAPPTYQLETQPGDLVGGRGLIVRPYLEIRRMIQEARAKAGNGQTSYGFGTAWHQGVIATLMWTEGDTPTPPMAHSGGLECTHPDSVDVPTKREIARERGAAEEHLESFGYKHGDISDQYADAVACTLRWLYGQTTRPPVTEDL
jgi:hypothetical protein